MSDIVVTTAMIEAGSIARLSAPRTNSDETLAAIYRAMHTARAAGPPSNAASLRAMSDEGLLGASAEAILDAAAEEIGRLRAAAIMARDTLLFFHEMGGTTPESVRTVIHVLDKALGHPPTPLNCVTIER